MMRLLLPALLAVCIAAGGAPGAGLPGEAMPKRAGAAPAAKQVYGVIQRESSRTFVPVRFVSEQFGFRVDWDAADRSVTVSGKGVTMPMVLDRPEVYVNGRLASSDADPAE